ncbi:hypothetical protein AMATHDRAFT_60460 [Amanita thiersii Skay4041]|uniref:Mid2 domain-containing protein n=1 Tax=Amanita thiersii Skay4041 TaxID=703135 RepID=A0A2A9NT05_9AGAR|nr:hypothetical protein AMATHDRAFT_60460 [Amanita thiersii Skay4041]
MRPWFHVCATFIALWCSKYTAFAFSFTPGNPTQCDDLSLTWEGGTPPFQLLIIPVFGVPRNITVPPAAFSNGKGSFSTQLALSEKQTFMITMSDAQGFATGGTTDVLTVGPPSKGGKCDTKGPSISFPFQLNSALQQCRPFRVDGYNQAVQPVSFYGVIPNGQSFEVHPPSGTQVFDWTANVAAGTSIVFFMVDGQGRQGGSSDVRKVGITDDMTCLNGNSPSSTSGPTSTKHPTTSTRGSHPSATSPTSTSESGHGVSIGAIAGTVIGAILFLAMVITMSLFFFRKKRNNARHSHPPFGSAGFQPQFDYTDVQTASPNTHPYRFPSNSLNSTSVASPYPLQDHGRYNVNPFESNTSMQYQSPLNTYQPYSTSNVNVYPSNQSELHNPYDPPSPSVVNATFSAVPSAPPTNRMSATDSEAAAYQRKAAAAGTSAYVPASRFIVHTDVEDELPPPNVDGVVELPPQYRERQGPLTVVNQPSELAYHRVSNASYPPSSS